MSNDLEDSFLFLRVTKMKKKAREFLALHATPAIIFTTPA
jgi:hypothetical protein